MQYLVQPITISQSVLQDMWLERSANLYYTVHSKQENATLCFLLRYITALYFVCFMLADYFPVTNETYS